MKTLLLRITMAFALAIGVVTLRAAPALADPNTATVTVVNSTPCDLTIASATVRGYPDPAPPMFLPAMSTVVFGSAQVGIGTGGTVMIQFPQSTSSNGDSVASSTGKIEWSVPDGVLGFKQPSFQLSVNAGAATTAQGASDGQATNWSILNTDAVGGSSNGGDQYLFDAQIDFLGSTALCPKLTPENTPTSVNVSAPSGGVNDLGVLTSYWDSAHSTEYVFYEDTSGNVDALSCGSGGCWKSQVVAAAGSISVGSSMISYYDGTNGHLFFQGMGGFDIVELKGNPPTSSGTVTDITAVTNPSNGGPGGSYYSYTNTAGANAYAIWPSSNLTGFWDGKNDHIFYEDANSNVHESYYNGSWWDHVVAPASSIASTPGSTLRSLWDGTNEHVYVSFMSQPGWAVSSYPSGGWTPSTISYSGGEGFNLTPVTPTGYTGWELLFAASPTTMNQIDAMYDIGEGGYNMWYNLSTPAVDYSWQVPTLAYADSAGAELFFVGPTNGHIYFYSQLAGPVIDLSASPGNDGAVVDSTGTPASYDLFSPLSGFFDGKNDHVFFFDTTGNVQEIYWSPGIEYYTEHVIGGAHAAIGTGSISNYQN